MCENQDVQRSPVDFQLIRIVGKALAIQLLGLGIVQLSQNIPQTYLAPSNPLRLVSQLVPMITGILVFMSHYFIGAWSLLKAVRRDRTRDIDPYRKAVASILSGLSLMVDNALYVSVISMIYQGKEGFWVGFIWYPTFLLGFVQVLMAGRNL